ncbi:hypothetical protein EDB86DRAFT_2990288 [Lactarius hatsudake]|nr:hypothetical protein EDB86DRAFT_2990288 [Lactarius hatsudake]
MSPGQLVGTVQDSKAKRQERLKSRFRDRGGIFVPAEGNDLAQLLLARGVNGESPNKRRSPRKSTAARRTTPKSARSAKVATKTPRTAPKRPRKSTVVPDANLADENAPLPQPRIAPVSTKKNKRSSTSKSKAPAPKSRGQRSRPKTREVDIDGSDVDAAPLLDSTGPSRPHAPTRPRKAFAHQLTDALNSAAGHCPPDSISTSVKPSHLAPSSSSLQRTSTGKGKRENQISRGRAVQSTAVDLARKTPSPSLEGARAARRGPRGGDNDSSDQSDLPLAQKLGKTAPADTRPKPGKKKGTKDARAPAARGKRTTSKAKRIVVAVDDADENEQTKRTGKSTVVRTQTSGATAIEVETGREAPENSRKRGREEGRGREEAVSPVAPPRGGDDVPDVDLPPTKRARVLQEKSAPRKRKERAKNVDDGNDAIRAANNENENGPPTKKRRRADPQTTAARYVVTFHPAVLAQRVRCPYVLHHRAPNTPWLHPSIVFSLLWLTHSFFSACSRRRPGKENENTTEQSKPANKASKGGTGKPPLSPTVAQRKPTAKGKPPLRPGGTRPRSRGLPPDVLRRIKVNAQTLEAPQDIDDDDPIDFLRS